MQAHKIIKLVNCGQTTVNANDYERLNKFRWFRSPNGYAQRQGWSGEQGSGGKHWQVFMHREINHTPEGWFTDHINGNKLDNRRENLRTVNKCWNTTNRPKHRIKKPSSQFKGVSFHPSTGLWRARVKDSTTYHKSEEQAALDYNRMALEEFGEFYKPNILSGNIVPTQRKPKTSQYRGVSFHRKSAKWRACIDRDGTTSWIGHYSTELEAAAAYDLAARELHGEAAKLNL